MAEAAAILINYERPPESEIYGRSLSTIRRLGAYMLGKSPSEAIVSPEAAQARVEFYTSVEEGFGTDMELGGGLEVRDFDERPIANGRVLAKDLKTPVSTMTESGLKCAQEKYTREAANEDQRFLPQLIRSEWDHKNALIVNQMATGETTYNTRIVISPFPEEAAAQSGDKYWRNIGYVPHLRRGFVQLYHATEEGVITGSLSFDGSNKQRLREIFDQFGVEIPSGEITDNWLKYAITRTLTTDEAKAMATTIANQAASPEYKKSTNTVDVTRQYKLIMERAFNESYIHICESLNRGQQTDGARELIGQLADNAHHFNERYARALYSMRANREQFTDDDSIVLHELLVYSTIEMMRALHLKSIELPSVSTHNPNKGYSVPFHLQIADPSLFQNMLSGFGADGAKNNRVYSACGLSISLGGDNTEKGPQSAFGSDTVNATSNTEESSGKKLMSCPFCSAKVFDDPCAAVLSCWDCRATVVNGRVVSKGDGGRKVRAAAREAKRQEAEAQAARKVNDAFSNVDVAAIEAEEKSRRSQPVAQVALTAAGV